MRVKKLAGRNSKKLHRNQILNNLNQPSEKIIQLSFFSLPSSKDNEIEESIIIQDDSYGIRDILDPGQER